jgi:hypothetical protein
MSSVLGSATVHMIVAIVPKIMKGLRRPHEWVQESLRSPMYGCTMAPDKGPASQTREIIDAGRPRDERYGYN